MDNSTKTRLVFLSCNFDAWVNPIAGLLSKVSKELGLEFFFVGGEKNKYINKNYVDFNRLKFKEGRKNRKVLTGERLDKIVEREYKFERLNFQNNKILRKEVKKNIINWYFQARTLLEILEPDIVILWNGMLYKRGIFKEVLKDLNIKFYYAEKGMLPESFYMDKEGIGAKSSLAKTREFPTISNYNLKKWKKRIKKMDREGKSAWEQPERIDLDRVKRELGIKENVKTIFFPGQVDADSNILLFSPNFRSVSSALKWIIKGICEKKCFLLVKPHPKGKLTKLDFEKIIGKKGKVRAKINVVDAIEICDLVITINSTVAFEAAIHGKPVVLLGKSILNNKEFVCQYKKGTHAQEIIENCLNQYQEAKEEKERSALSFAEYLDSQYYAYRCDRKKTRKIIQKLVNSLETAKDKKFTSTEINRLISKASKVTLRQISQKLFIKVKNKLE